ncbi:MAG: hypothetical protein N4A33_12800 [Bacteriovoracaceae bacterium]|nr:hypothetical protein [Bacteriovoracaceae bacterium]
MIGIEERLKKANSEVITEIKNKLAIFIKRRAEIEEAMIGFLGYDDKDIALKRVERIFEIIIKIIQS